ncbi:hypothetical protein MPER_02270 [Moniliophthora perniciosa FA553]|nr:hypothetical protein MPER_02270 [Moniliophthora perniciosa FA553]
MTLIKLTDLEIKALNGIHRQPGMHWSLLVGLHIEDIKVLGWTYEQWGGK